MPGTHDHLKDSTIALSNPFEDADPRVNGFTASKINLLQTRLDKQLGPEYLSTRPGAGGTKVHYIAAEKVISLANDVFGFNGWSSQLQRIDVDFVDETRDSKFSLGISIVMRVTLKDGTFHEDIGYGQIENAKTKASAFEKAKKEAATDALKRALRNFGNVLGNCLYDKEYIKNVTKIRVTPTAWNEKNLHRHPTYVPPKEINHCREGSSHATRVPESEETKSIDVKLEEKIPNELADLDEDFEIELFDDIDITDVRPDEVVVAADGAPDDLAGRVVAQSGVACSTPQATDIHTPLPAQIGFLTSRHATIVNSAKSNPQVLARLEPFNPNAESPSIRRTSGIDHGTSGPVKRQKVGQELPMISHHGPPAALKRGVSAPVHGNVHNPSRDFINPANEAGRRIGLPHSPSRTSPYKPPGATSAQDGASRTPARRTPLTDVTNVNNQPHGGSESEKEKVEGTNETRHTMPRTRT